MVSWYHCQSEYARNISGEFLSSVYAQLKFILHVTDCLMIAWHHEIANFQFQVIGIAVFVLQDYRITNFEREILHFLEMTLKEI